MGGGVRVRVYSLFFSRDVFVSPKITHFKQLSVAQSWRIGFILINQKPHKFGEFGWDEAYSSIMICNPRIIKWSPPGQHLPIHWPPLPGKKHTYLENNCNFGTTMKRKKDAKFTSLCHKCSSKISYTSNGSLLRGMSFITWIKVASPSCCEKFIHLLCTMVSAPQSRQS